SRHDFFHCCQLILRFTTGVTAPGCKNKIGIQFSKLPDRVECVDSLPLTAVGKVDKKQLCQWLASRASA
ncbi:hypothetical protein NE615_24760, partial [Escherichia coli]|uniref:hypothetical protein n=1 Tax=Escherichia coli TaxID=562 RepID=UPI00210C050C